MKLNRIIFFIIKLLITWVTCYLLLTIYKIENQLEVSQIVEIQLLNPFPWQEGQTISFWTIIMLLGLYFVSFWNTYLMLTEMSFNMKDVIKYHSYSPFRYHLNILTIIIKTYWIEFMGLLVSILTILILIKGDFTSFIALFWLFISWFFVDLFCYFWVIILCKESVLVLILISFEIIFRFFLMTRVHWLLLVTVLYMICNFLMEVRYVRNEKCQYQKR